MSDGRGDGGPEAVLGGRLLDRLEDPLDLQAREAGVSAFAAAMTQLAGLTEGDATQAVRHRQILQLADRRIEMARTLAVQRARLGFAEPWPAHLSAAAQQIGRQVLQLTDQMRQHERQQLELKLQAQQRHFRAALIALSLAFVLVLGALVPAYAGAAHHARKRDDAERLTRDLIEHLPVTAWQIRNEPGQGRRFAHLREAVLQERGFSSAAARQDINVVLSSIADEDRGGVAAAMDEAERTLQGFNMRYRVKHPDGRPRWVHSRATLRREADGTIVWNGYWADITEHMKLEQSVAAAHQQLAASHRELEAFSYSVSHDLRAPLASIHGFSQELWRRLHLQLDERGRHYLSRILAGATQMSTLIDGLLALASVSRVEILRERVDLSALAHAVAQELAESTPARQIAFEVEPGLQACGDARLLRQVWANLLGNAWKFTGHTELPRIQVGRMPAEPGMAGFFVRDNGAGFDMAHAAKLFGTFERLHTAAEYPGTGIGLATVQRVVVRHGGRVWAEGEPGRGATVYFTLPALPPA